MTLTGTVMKKSDIGILFAKNLAMEILLPESVSKNYDGKKKTSVKKSFNKK